MFAIVSCCFDVGMLGLVYALTREKEWCFFLLSRVVVK